MSHSTFYAALGLDDHERATVVRSAYRDLARRYHPARVGPGGEQNFRPIDEAYRILSDSSLRRAYDTARACAEGAPAERGSNAADASAPGRGPAAPAVEVRSLRRAVLEASPAGEAMLARFARNFTGVGVPKSESSVCLHVRLVLAPRERAANVELHIGVPVLARCEACAGHGGASRMLCRACDGGGFVEVERVLTVTIGASEPDGSRGNLSLVPLGIHNFYLHAIVQTDPAFN